MSECKLIIKLKDYYKEDEIKDVALISRNSDLIVCHPNHTPKVLHKISKDEHILKDIEIDMENINE